MSADTNLIVSTLASHLVLRTRRFFATQLHVSRHSSQLDYSITGNLRVSFSRFFIWMIRVVASRISNLKGKLDVTKCHTFPNLWYKATFTFYVGSGWERLFKFVQNLVRNPGTNLAPCELRRSRPILIRGKAYVCCQFVGVTSHI